MRVEMRMRDATLRSVVKGVALSLAIGLGCQQREPLSS